MATTNYVLRYSSDYNGVELILPTHRVVVDQPLTVSNTINILVWNIFKQKRKDWLSILKNCAMSNQLILLQEAHTTPVLINYINRYYKVADQVPAFPYNNSFSGVMTLAKAYPLSVWCYKEKEPLIRIPKSALVTVYALANTTKTLMVANIHAVNFSFGIKTYQQQLKQLLQQMDRHEGPIILGGDFNTWSRQRLELLYQLTRNINLLPVNFNLDLRKTFLGRPLDFIFYRDLTLTNASIMQTVASDHNPLFVTFQY